MTTTEVALAMTGTILVKELSSQAFNLALSQLTEMLQYFSQRPELKYVEVRAKLGKLIPKAKIEIIQSGLMEFEWIRCQSKVIDVLCERLTQLVQDIQHEVASITQALNVYNATYFKWWYPLDVGREFETIEMLVTTLLETHKEFQSMLPTCIHNLECKRNYTKKVTTVALTTGF